MSSFNIHQHQLVRLRGGSQFQAASFVAETCKMLAEKRARTNRVESGHVAVVFTPSTRPLRLQIHQGDARLFCAE